jgi:undecaprenyl-diphosphatase
MFSWLARRVVRFLRPQPAAAAAPDTAASPVGVPIVGEAPRSRWSGRLAALRTRLFASATVAGAALFGALAWLVQAEHLAGVDLALTRAVQTLDDPRFAALMRAVSQPGSPALSMPLIAGTALVLGLLGQPLAAGITAAAGSVALLAVPLKLLIARRRPDDDLVPVAGDLPDHSFPSGHTLGYVAFFGFLAYLCYTRLRRGRLRTALLWALGALILLVGPSRVYLGYHWPSDVLASYALGLVCLLALVGLYARETAALGTIRAPAGGR